MPVVTERFHLPTEMADARVARRLRANDRVWATFPGVLQQRRIWHHLQGEYHSNWLDVPKERRERRRDRTPRQIFKRGEPAQICRHVGAALPACGGRAGDDCAGNSQESVRQSWDMASREASRRLLDPI